MSTLRGRPPCLLCLAGGIMGATIAHCSSVRSDGYLFRDWSSCNIDAHSSVDGLCANYLTNLPFCHALFPDSLSLCTPMRWHLFVDVERKPAQTCTVWSRQCGAFPAGARVQRFPGSH